MLSISSIAKEITDLPVYLLDFKDVFDTKEATKLLDQEEFKYTIKTIRLSPFSLLYNLLEPQLKVLCNYIKDILRKKQIRYSISLVDTLILFIPKKNSSLQLYINYYRLNKVTIKNQYLLSLINKTLDYLIGTIIFIKLDLKDTYYYIYIKEEDI